MPQSMGSQKARHDLATEQQQMYPSFLFFLLQLLNICLCVCVCVCVDPAGLFPHLRLCCRGRIPRVEGRSTWWWYVLPGKHNSIWCRAFGLTAIAATLSNIEDFFFFLMFLLF